MNTRMNIQISQPALNIIISHGKLKKVCKKYCRYKAITLLNEYRSDENFCAFNIFDTG